MPQARAVFVLLCVCFLDLAAKEMEKPCPVFRGRWVGIEQCPVPVAPRVWGVMSALALAWNEMGAAETGGVWVSLFPPF